MTTMDCHSASLLDRLTQWPLSGADAPQAFEDRLADDNGWTRGFASRVAVEYRRFLLLSQVAGHTVTPSRQVDAAWHLHLTHTRGYRLMCMELFGHCLHHEPSKGPEELEHYRSLYEQTLASYERVFGAPAPADVWPPAYERFAAIEPAVQASGVKLALGLRTPKSLATVGACWMVIIGVLLAAAGWPVPWDAAGASHFLALYATGVVAVGLLSIALRSKGDAWSGTPSHVDVYEAAWLAGGAGRVAATATTVLVDRGLMALEPERDATNAIQGAKLIRTPLRAELQTLHPVELALSRLPAGTVAAGTVAACLRGECVSIERRLRRAGLLQDTSFLPVDRAAVFALSLVLLVIGTQRVAQGLFGHLPVGLLLGLLSINLMQVFVVCARDHLSTAGRLALRRVMDSVAMMRGRLAAADGTHKVAVVAALLPLAFAVEGTASVIQDERFAGINFVVPDEGNNRTGDSTSTAGCGGGGGGCGGCGGCGG